MLHLLVSSFGFLNVVFDLLSNFFFFFFGAKDIAIQMAIGFCSRFSLRVQISMDHITFQDCKTN
jgi:hypothetical protein